MKNDKKKVLVSCVGLSDPKTDEGLGPIATLAQYLKPNEVWLLPTRKARGIDSTEENARLTEKHLNESLKNPPKVRQERLKVNPTDYGQLRESLTEEIRFIEDQLVGEDYAFHVNITSGTSQEAAILLNLADIGVLQGTLWSVERPSHVEGDDPADRVSEVEMVFLEEDKILDRAGDLIEGYNFGAAREEIDRLKGTTTDPGKKYNAEQLGNLLQAYSHWDMLQIDQAQERIKEVLENEETRGYAELIELIKKQEKDLESYITGSSGENERVENKTNLLDLYHNAERRRSEGNFVDCITRINRFVEGVMTYILRDRYGIDSNDLGESDQEKSVRRFIAKSNIGPDNFNRVHFLLFDQAKEVLLNHFHDKQLRDFRSIPISREIKEKWADSEIKPEGPVRNMGDLCDKLKEKRNNSIATHGFEPVDENLAEISLDVAKSMLERLLGFSEVEIENYSFSGEKVVNALTTFLEAQR